MIIDSPPVMAVTDASVIAHIASGVVYVVGCEQTSKHVASAALDQLEGAKAKFVGGILNRVDVQRNPFYYSHYYRKAYTSALPFGLARINQPRDLRGTQTNTSYTTVPSKACRDSPGIEQDEPAGRNSGLTVVLRQAVASRNSAADTRLPGVWPSGGTAGGQLFMSLIRQSAWAACAAVTVVGSRFLLTAVLARKLSPSAFGPVPYGQWLVDLAFLLCSFGATGAIGRYAAEYRGNPAILSGLVRRWLPYALGLPLLAGTCVAAGVRLSVLELTRGGFAALTVWAVTSGLWAMQTAALTGQQRFDLVLLANSFAGVVMLIGAWAVPRGAAGPELAFLAMALAAGGAMLVGLSETMQLHSASTRAACASAVGPDTSVCGKHVDDSHPLKLSVVPRGNPHSACESRR